MNRNPRVVAIIQARFGSSRLHGKALLPIAGRPLLEHVVERVKAIRGIDHVVVATSVSDRDAAIADLAYRLGVDVYRGIEWDVLGRVYETAVRAKADVVMRVTGDCPLFAPDVAELCLEMFRDDPIAYVWNDTLQSGYPDGTDCEVFPFNLLEDASALAQDRSDREHVTSWIRRRAETLRTLRYRPELYDDVCASRKHLKLSVDRREDLDYVRAISAFIPTGDLSLAATLRAVDLYHVQQESNR